MGMTGALSTVDPLNYVIGAAITGGWVFTLWFIRMLFTGKLATFREINEKNAELEYLKKSVLELQEQNNVMLRELGTTVTSVLEAVREVAEEKGQKT
jgi:cell division protein FtsB